MKHKITAIRLREHNGEMILEGLTQSPRGTKVFANQFKFKPAIDNKPQRRIELEAGIKAILGQTE